MIDPKNNVAEEEQTECLCIWDSESEPEVAGCVVYCWNGYKNINLIRSMSHYIESNSDRLRKKYLAFIHDLGVSKIGDKNSY